MGKRLSFIYSLHYSHNFIHKLIYFMRSYKKIRFYYLTMEIVPSNFKLPSW